MPKLGSVVLGLLCLLGGTIGCFMLAGNRPATLFYFVPALGMLLITIGCSLIGFGIRGPIIVLRALATAVWGSERTHASEATRTISACIGYVYGAGAFVFCASLMSLTKSFPEIVSFGLTEHVGEHVVATLASLIYTFVFAELVLRPLKHRLSQPAEGSGRA